MIVTRPSHIHGIGCFARQDALQGTNLGPMPRETRGFNHGCEPNVELRPRSIKKRGKRMIDFDPIALRDIKAGEELLVNYYRSGKIPTYFERSCKCPAHQKRP